MKRFTLKDFILYNGPCFSCGNKVNINVLQAARNEEKSKYIKIKSNLEGNVLSFNLKCKYSFSVMIKIDVTTNKYELHWLKWDKEDAKTYKDVFDEYIRHYDVYIESSCPTCNTYVASNHLKFTKGYITPLTLSAETLIIRSDPNMYIIHSKFDKKESVLSIWDGKGTRRHERFTLPLLPLYKVGNREKAIAKIKKLIIFS